MKLIEAKKTLRGFYFKVHVNNKKTKEEPIYEEFRWGSGGDVENEPEDLIDEIRRQVNNKYFTASSSTNLPQKGKLL